MSNYVRVEYSWDLDSYVTCRMCGWGACRTPEFAHDDARRHAAVCPAVQAATERDRLAALEPPC